MRLKIYIDEIEVTVKIKPWSYALQKIITIQTYTFKRQKFS